MTVKVPIALTIAGSDPSGGAGIQADLKTFAEFDVYGGTVITALTVQNTRGVFGVHAVPQDFIRAQFDAIVGDLDVGAIKTGMLGDAATVRTVAEMLKRTPDTPVIVDPVMVASSGDPLLSTDAIAVLREELAPLAAVLTPNLPEAAMLLGEAIATDEAAAARQGQALLRLGARAVLVKGGHGDGPEAVDVLVTGDGVRRFAHPRIATANTHGTGCTLSAAIAAGLALGRPLNDAVAAAVDFVWRAVRSGSARSIGGGYGPIDHGFQRRTREED